MKEQLVTSRIGRIVDFDKQGQVWVNFPENPRVYPVQAFLARFYSLSLLQRATQEGLDIRLDFPGNSFERPVLEEIYHPLGEEEESYFQTGKKVIRLEADEIILSASQKITMECGSSTSLTLTSIGGIIQKAKNLLSQAKRSYRIRGGEVKIN